MAQKKTPLAYLIAPVRALFVGDASGGILLILVAAAAMIAANSPLAGEYRELFYGELGWTPIAKLHNLQLWINDALMAIFFFVVGLEVKREILDGQLANPQRRRLPMVAAIAGMALPALVFMLVSGGGDLTRGWAIPAATDIAFAMGVLGLLGRRVPASLRLFLLTVAIVDDIGAVLVIALFYTPSIKLAWLVASLLVFGAMIGLNRLRVHRFTPYIALALVLWFCVLNSGVHATIAGVVAALTIPMHAPHGHSMLERMEHALAPWNAYLVVPVFGFANAGVSLAGLGLDALFEPLPIAIAAGLMLGKQLGIFLAVWISHAIGFAERPIRSTWPEVWGVSVLCGIGFTMSLFISSLAFPATPLLIEEAKLGILTGSAISGLLGYVILRLTTTHPASEERTATVD